jgi:hypothetical protein
LSSAALSGAFLNEANLGGAALSSTNLSGAFLNKANLSSTKLNGAFLSGTPLWGTVFAYLDLRKTKGLLDIVHNAPSRIELYMVQLSQDGSAFHFLRGAGVPDEWIDDYRAHMMRPIQYHSLFIYYSSKDNIFT